MSEWMPENPYIKQLPPASFDICLAYEEGCRDTARKIIEHIKEEIGWSQLSKDECSIEWCISLEDWEQLCKEVGL